MNSATFTTYRLTRTGMVRPGSARSFNTATPEDAARNTARRSMTEGEYATATVNEADDVWTFTPATGSPVIIWVTEAH